MTVVRITFNPTAFSGTVTVNGYSSRWTLGKAGNITVASRLPHVTKAQVIGAIRRARSERMEAVRAAKFSERTLLFRAAPLYFLHIG